MFTKRTSCLRRGLCKTRHILETMLILKIFGNSQKYITINNNVVHVWNWIAQNQPDNKKHHCRSTMWKANKANDLRKLCKLGIYRERRRCGQMPDINHSHHDIDVSEMLSAPVRTKARKTTLLIKRPIYHQRVEGLPIVRQPRIVPCCIAAAHCQRHPFV